MISIQTGIILFCHNQLNNLCTSPKEGVDEIINIQPQGNKAKAYQVKQVRNLILKYKYGGDDNV